MGWMRREILLLVAVCCLLIVPAAVFAESAYYEEGLTLDSIDMGDAPEVTTHAELADLLWTARENRYRSIPVTLMPPLTMEDLQDICLTVDWLDVRWESAEAAGSTIVLLSVDYLPGARMADAYLRGMEGDLTQEERDVLDQAIAFLQGEKYPVTGDIIARERAIYDWIKEKTVYSADNERGNTALGALADGEANRLGYLDAFSMLCTMAEIPCQTVLYEARGGFDAWGLVELSGKWYVVDPSYGEDPAGTPGFPYIYFNAALDMLPDAGYLRGDEMPGEVAGETDEMYAYGNPAFPALVRVSEGSLRDAMLERGESGPLGSIVWMVDPFDGDIDALFLSLAEPTEDGRSMLQIGQGVQMTLSNRLYLQVDARAVDLQASHEGGLEALRAQYDLRDAALDSTTIDFFALKRIETEEELRALMAECREGEAYKIPLRLAPPLDTQTVFTLCADFDWAMVEQETLPNNAGETHVLVTCTYLSGVNIARAYREKDTSTLTDVERQAYDIALEFFDTEYPEDGNRVTQERSIYDFVQASSDYWVGKPQAQRVEDICSAVDVLVKGRSNCAGFADAFWMLCDMAGFSVRNVPGTLEGQPHMWNLIELDGTWYFVDPTKSLDERAQKVYVFFNAGSGLMAPHYAWEESLLPVPIAGEIDKKYAYGNLAFPGYGRVADRAALQAAVVELATKEATEQYWLCDTFEGDVEEFTQDLAEKGVFVTEGSWLEEGEALYFHLVVVRQ